MSTCRACHNPIRWALTAKGHRIPLDPTPVEGGNVTLTRTAGGVDHATVHGQPVEGAAYMPHHATCPQAASFKRRPRR